eukprot:gene7267-biopygen5885
MKKWHGAVRRPYDALQRDLSYLLDISVESLDDQVSYRQIAPRAKW